MVQHQLKNMVQSEATEFWSSRQYEIMILNSNTCINLKTRFSNFFLCMENFANTKQLLKLFNLQFFATLKIFMEEKN